MGSLDARPGVAGTRILRTPLRASYDAGSERLLYIQGAGTLKAQRLQLDPPGLVGDPATVAEGVGIATAIGYAEFSASANNTLFYRQGSAGVKWRFGWRER